MPRLEDLARRVPGGGRVYYSGRWLRRLLALWRDPNRQFLAYPPGHFASPLPNVAEVNRDHPTLSEPRRQSLPGIELNLSLQLHLLQQFQPHLGAAPFPAAPTPEFRYAFENSFFSYADGLYLYGILKLFRPQRIIEVGSGFSSALMLDTRERDLSWNVDLTFIEPYPVRLRTLLRANEPATLLETRVQDTPRELFGTLEANDVLLIDSSHVSKIGSDVNVLFFEILPSLKPGVLVHIHDIFWPFEYPRSWYDLGWAWNEAYLLRALLQDSSRYEIVLFPSYLEVHHTEAVRASSPQLLKRAEATPTTGASSLWLRAR